MKHSLNEQAHVKQRFRPVALAIQADARAYHGGIPDLADQLGRNYGSLRNALCPTTYNAEPTLSVLLETIEATGGDRTIAAIARLGGKRVVDADCDHSDDSPDSMLRKLTSKSGHLLSAFAEALEDGRLDSSEKARLADDLDLLAAEIHHVLGSLRS